MNSVAIPAARAGTQLLGSEADLVRQAARGEAEALAELFRRHSGPAWRLAQAVASDPAGARTAFVDGFVRAVRSDRLVRRTGSAFRPYLLSSVYRTAADQAYDRPAGPVATRRPKGGRQLALAEACFRTLPERWRAALWLTDVENMDSERLGAVLGVSTGVAEQLVARGRRGLAGRYAQAHAEVPDHVGEVLRQLAAPVPSDLADATASCWSSLGAERLSLLAPMTAWLEEHGSRPLSMAAGVLVGIGLIGMGVVGTGGTLRTQLGASGTTSLGGALPVAACAGAGCPPSPSGSTGGFSQALDRAFGLGGTGAALTGASTGSGSPSPSYATGSSGTANSGPATSGTGGSGTGGSGTGGSGTGGSGTGGSGTGGSGTGGQPGPGQGSSPITLPGGLGTVTVSGGTVSTTLLKGTATGTVGTCGAGVSIGSTQAGTCSSPSTGSSGSSGVSSVVYPSTSVITTVVGSTSGSSSPTDTTPTTSSGTGDLIPGL